MTTLTRRGIVLALIVATLGLGRPGRLGSVVPVAAAPAVWPGSEARVDEAAGLLSVLAAADPGDKVDHRLLAPPAAGEPKSGTLWVAVQSTTAVDLSAYSDFVHHFTWPAGEHVSIVRVAPADVLAIASLPVVYAVSAFDADQGEDAAVGMPADGGPVGHPDLGEWTAARRAAPAWSEEVGARVRRTDAGPAAVGGTAGGDATVQGWYDVRKGHAAMEAWELGYRGEGVRVAVLDFEADFAHPDLQGTWAVVPEGDPYAGWPQVFDPRSGGLAVADLARAPEARSSRLAQSGWIELYQTSAVTETTTVSGTVRTACFQPGMYRSPTEPFVLGERACDYVVPESDGVQVRFGHHPDGTLIAESSLQGFAGEWPGVLLVNSGGASDYDTVYVDLDGDRDFTDEKPMTKADPLGWRDVTGDGLADVSAGLLYWIADGQEPRPGSWLFGLDESIPDAGRMIGIQYVTGNHGTMCASNVVSQGVLKVPADRVLGFRDLPAGGSPPATNQGTAPGASLVSVGSVYSGDLSFAAAWRYAVFGHDRDRHDDDIQVASNSYGWSGVDNDGWDVDSRLVDYYVRRFSPTTSFLMATGNGAPGYGTTAPPKPVVAMGIASSTQMGSTGGTDSITDTTQITFGDVIPFSNRGPGAGGLVGVQLAADGANAAGAYPINYLGNGAYANVEWGGTSRSTPVAAGAMALVYQAFEDGRGRWPTWEEARAILMSGARYNGYDPFTVGAGVLDAGDAVRIASGRRGLYATPAEWTAGEYHGYAHPAFARLVAPGEVATTTITLHNPTDRAVYATISARTPRRIASHPESLTVDRTKEAAADGVPDHLLAVPREVVPDGAELMVVRGRYPLAELDPDGDYAADNTFDLSVLQHTDINGDGRLWDDRNHNGVVDHLVMPDKLVRATWTGGSVELAAIEGAITRPLVEGVPVTGTLGWFGRGCVDDPRPQDVSGRIALIARGECKFVEKITAAQQAGATGVVVFTNDDPVAVMGGDGDVLGIPGLMIERQPGEDLRDLLLAGASVSAEMVWQRITGLQGLGGTRPVVWSQTELQRYEYMRFSSDGNTRNNWAVSVHHPLERWSDGIYVGLAHIARSGVVTDTHVALRYDFYAYEPWEALTLPTDTVRIRAGESIDIPATLSLPADAPFGALQGAIFVDYSRTPAPTIYLPAAANRASPGDVPVTPPLGTPAAVSTRPQIEPVDAEPPDVLPETGAEADLLPGGYELPFLRTVIPVNANVAAEYDWQTAVSFGGETARDADAPYDNGAMWGTFKWDWRPESGDWRFFFLDADEPPARTWWLYRTTWDEGDEGRADIDTRVYGPIADRFADPDDPANREEDMSDPLWYGPYTLGLVARSPYLVSGSVWRFDTTSGVDDDWLKAPVTRGGLHEVMLHNVLFSGSQFAMPFRTDVGSAQVAPDALALTGATCGSVTITSTLAFDPLLVRGFGVSAPETIEDLPASQDVQGDQTTASVKRDLVLDREAGKFEISIVGPEGDDLDLFVLYDANRDATFDFDTEIVGRGTTETAVERVALAGIRPAGAYQIWVHGFLVNGTDHTFDLTIDLVTGESLAVGNAPPVLAAGSPTTLQVCADLPKLEGVDGPATGIVTIGPSGAPTLFQLPVTWRAAP